MIYKEIHLLKKFKKKYPWTGGYKIKKNKFKWFLNELCAIYNIKTPKLIIPQYPNKLKWTKKIHGDCSKYRIRINNFSIITLLHEFKHWVDFHNSQLKWQKEELQQREYDAYYYSARMFYTVWPERIKMISELNTLIDNNDSNVIINKIRELKKEYKKTNINYKSHAEICAIIDIIIKEV